LSFWGLRRSGKIKLMLKYKNGITPYKRHLNKTTRQKENIFLLKNNSILKWKIFRPLGVWNIIAWVSVPSKEILHWVNVCLVSMQLRNHKMNREFFWIRYASILILLGSSLFHSANLYHLHCCETNFLRVLIFLDLSYHGLLLRKCHSFWEWPLFFSFLVCLYSWFDVNVVVIACDVLAVTCLVTCFYCATLGKPFCSTGIFQ